MSRDTYRLQRTCTYGTRVGTSEFSQHIHTHTHCHAHRKTHSHTNQNPAHATRTMVEPGAPSADPRAPFHTWRWHSSKPMPRFMHACDTGRTHGSSRAKVATTHLDEDLVALPRLLLPLLSHRLCRRCIDIASRRAALEHCGDVRRCAVERRRVELDRRAVADVVVVVLLLMLMVQQLLLSLSKGGGGGAAAAAAASALLLLVIPREHPQLVLIERWLLLEGLCHIESDELGNRVHEDGAVVEGAVLDEEPNLL